MVWASILVSFWEPFGILFPYFFGIDFRMPFWVPKILNKSQLGGFWSDFGPKAINRKESQRNPRRHFFRLFQEPSFGIDFWVILGRFGLHFWWFWDDNPTFFRIILDLIFDGFGMIIRHVFRIILDFAIILWHNFRRAILIQFAIFLNLFSDMSDHIFYGILFT